jgi:hypothetical protein
MSSFGSSSGWGGGGRRSLQYDSHQSSDLSVPYGESKEGAEKKKIGPLAWLDRKRQEHDERKDKKNRAKSPPGSSSELATPYGLLSPKLEPTSRGRSMEMPSNMSNHELRSRQDSSDVTPTGTSPNPLTTTPPALQPAKQPPQLQREEEQKRMPLALQQQQPDPNTLQTPQPPEQRLQQQPAPETSAPQPGTTVDAPQEAPRRPSPNKSGLYPLDADVDKSA